MPRTRSRTPSAPPRLMICSSAGTAASPPSRPKRLVPGKRLARNRSKPSDSISFFRMAILPSRREADLLVAPLDAPLQPGLLGRIGDVHVLHADTAAVGAPQQGEDLAQGRGFQAQHIVEEDRPVEVRLAEAVRRRLQLAGVAGGHRDAERIEIGLQMAAHAVGADHHDRAQGIERARADLVDARRRLGLGDPGRKGAGRPPARRRRSPTASRGAPRGSARGSRTAAARRPRRRPTARRRRSATRDRPSRDRRPTAPASLLHSRRCRRTERTSRPEPRSAVRYHQPFCSVSLRPREYRVSPAR